MLQCKTSEFLKSSKNHVVYNIPTKMVNLSFCDSYVISSIAVKFRDGFTQLTLRSMYGLKYMYIRKWL